MGSFMKLNFETQFKTEFLLPFTGCRKVLGKMSAGVIHGLSRDLELTLIFIFGKAIS